MADNGGAAFDPPCAPWRALVNLTGTPLTIVHSDSGAETAKTEKTQHLKPLARSDRRPHPTTVKPQQMSAFYAPGTGVCRGGPAALHEQRR